MSNRWGTFCNDEEDTISRGPYPPLHCLTRGESIGLVLIAEAGIVSILALLVAIGLILRNVVREMRKRSRRRRLIQQPMDIFLLSLFCADIFLSIGTCLNLKWVQQGKVEVGITCRTQSVFVTIGASATALTTLAIAVHTFCMVWWQRGRRLFGAWTTVGLLWLFVALYIPITASHFNGTNFFHPAPYWCWIGKYYVRERVVGEYLWLWSALFASLILYIPLFLWSWGYITVDPENWWKFSIHKRTETADNTSEQRRRSLVMIAYPLLYAVTVLPVSIARWKHFGQENGSDSISHSSATAQFIGRFIFGLSGIFNVLLFLTTRRRLLLFEEEETSNKADEESTASPDTVPDENHPADVGTGVANPD